MIFDFEIEIEARRQNWVRSRIAARSAMAPVRNMVKAAISDEIDLTGRNESRRRASPAETFANASIGDGGQGLEPQNCYNQFK